VRASGDSKAVEIAYDAIVRQNTGEVWDDVRLTLSTARPSLGGAAPEPQPWFVDVFEAIPMAPPAASMKLSRSRAAADASGIGSAEGFAVMQANEPQMTSATASLAAGLTSAAFSIAAPSDVPADGSAQRVSVTQLRLEGELEHRTTPRLLPSAFLGAKLRNTSEFPLLPGSVSVFLDGNYVANSGLGQVLPGEDFDLALGADESVAVERRLVRRFVETVGLTQGTRRTSYEFAITVTNKRSSPARLVLTETVPVSRNEKIVVKVSAPAERDRAVARPQPGRLVWTLDLKPGEKRVLPVQFSIEHPSELPVIGVE
jgi:uncharacterized protein (TIGR02231 family)